MKKTICFCILCLYLGFNAYSQENTKLNHYVSVKKGKITMKDGTTEKFKHLKFNDRIITYNDQSDNRIEKNISDVIKIAKRGNCSGYGAIAGGVFTLALIVDTELTASSHSAGSINRKVDKLEYVDFGVLFVGMGMLVGSFFKKYKTMYEDKGLISFSPSYISTPDGRRYAMLSLRFNIK